MDLQEILSRPEEFRYQLLGRLQSDCNYYLGNGNRSADHALWAHDEAKQIETMKALWNTAIQLQKAVSLASKAQRTSDTRAGINTHSPDHEHNNTHEI